MKTNMLFLALMSSSPYAKVEHSTAQKYWCSEQPSTCDAEIKQRAKDKRLRKNLKRLNRNESSE